MSQNTDQSHITLRVGRRAEIAVNALLVALAARRGLRTRHRPIAQIAPRVEEGAFFSTQLRGGSIK